MNIRVTRILTICFLLFSTSSFAGSAENIAACIAEAKNYADLNLDEFDAEYNGNVLAFSKVTWRDDDVVCEVKVGDVYNLTIQGKQWIYEGFAGKESYELDASLRNETDHAIEKLKSRISLLNQRMDEATKKLQAANPDHAEITKFIEHGIDKASGSSD